MLAQFSAYQGWKFLHFVGIFGFLLAHGVSVGVALKLRRERDPPRIDALLQLSSSSITWLHPSVLVLVVSGVVTGFVLNVWSQAWPWVSIGILVLMYVVMFAIGTAYYKRVRAIVGAMSAGSEAVSPEQLHAVLRSPRALVNAGLGFAGLVAILFLMVFKPF